MSKEQVYRFPITRMDSVPCIKRADGTIWLHENLLRFMFKTQKPVFADDIQQFDLEGYDCKVDMVRMETALDVLAEAHHPSHTILMTRLTSCWLSYVKSLKVVTMSAEEEAKLLTFHNAKRHSEDQGRYPPLTQLPAVLSGLQLGTIATVRKAALALSQSAQLGADRSLDTVLQLSRHIHDLNRKKEDAVDERKHLLERIHGANYHLVKLIMVYRKLTRELSIG